MKRIFVLFCLLLSTAANAGSFKEDPQLQALILQQAYGMLCVEQPTSKQWFAKLANVADRNNADILDVFNFAHNVSVRTAANVAVNNPQACNIGAGANELR